MERLLRKKLKDGRFDAVSPIRSAAMSAVRGRGNRTTELVFRMALVRQKVAGWVLHPKELPGLPDIYFPESRLAVFLDGCFWHGCPRCGHVPRTNRGFWSLKIRRNRERDRAKRRKLRAQGVRVVSFWEHQLRDDISHCVRLVTSKL